jgi:DNA repair exonuclease SbcCD ATPase subunit
MSAAPKFAFPTISNVRLERFSLFTRRPDLELDIHAGVLCLAGANGLGKSTFLAAVSFGLTGVVPDPARSFKSVNEYVRDCAPFTKAFFDGRISELDRDAASIRLELQIAGHTYRLTRGIFEPRELRELVITGSPGEDVSFDGGDATPEDRLARFEDQLTLDAGFQQFNQFIFLQHFVLTFDESRHLLFWDERALEQALHITFSTDLTEAVQADKLRRDMERADSRARNYNFQASDVRGRLEIIRETLGSAAQTEETPEDVVERHRTLVQMRDRQQGLVQDTLRQQADADLHIAEASAALTGLRETYAQEL